MVRDITEAQRAWLVGELGAWREAGVVTADQADAVLNLYPTAHDLSVGRQSKGVLALLALASSMVGMGVLLLVGYNWEAMPPPLKLAAVFAAVASAHAGGLLARYRLGFRGGSEAAFLLGSLLYGAGIWLIAQVFHVNSGSADGFWWWALGVLPFALALETETLHVLLVALLALWSGYVVFGRTEPVSWVFGRLPVANGAYSLFVLAAPGLAWAYRKHSARAVALYVPLFAWWVILQPFAWRFQVNPVFFIGAVGGLLLLAAEAHPRGSPMAIPYRFYGVALTAGALVPISFHGFNKESGGWHADHLQGVYLTTAVVVLAGSALVVSAVLRQLARAEPVSIAEELAGVVRRAWLPCALIATMAALGFWNAVVGDPVVPTLAANALMIVLALWLMQVGLHEDRGRPFGAGVAYFLLWAVLRYIDLFGAYGGMLGAALVFFLCGASLLGVAFYWRNRKAVSLG